MLCWGVNAYRRAFVVNTNRYGFIINARKHSTHYEAEYCNARQGRDITQSDDSRVHHDCYLHYIINSLCHKLKIC